MSESFFNNFNIFQDEAKVIKEILSKKIAKNLNIVTKQDFIPYIKIVDKITENYKEIEEKLAQNKN